MRYRARVMRLGPHDVVTDEALAGLVGQRPRGNGGGTVVEARVEDGWLVLDVEHEDGMDCDPPTPVDSPTSVEWSCPTCGASFRRRFARSST